MERAVRSVLFAFGVVIGSVFVIFATRAMDEPGEDAAPAEPAREKGHEARTEGAEADELDDDELEARAREHATRRAEVISAAAASEAVDPDWGPAAEQRIIERFAARAPVGFKLLSTTCKTSLCVAEIETPSRSVSTQQSGWHRFLGVSSGYVYHRGEEGSAFRTVVFVARNGHTLPVVKNNTSE